MLFLDCHNKNLHRLIEAQIKQTTGDETHVVLFDLNRNNEQMGPQKKRSARWGWNFNLWDNFVFFFW